MRQMLFMAVTCKNQTGETVTAPAVVPWNSLPPARPVTALM